MMPGNDAAPDSILDQPVNVTVWKSMTPREAFGGMTTLRKLATSIQTRSAPTKEHLWWLKLSKFGTVPSDKGYLRHNENLEDMYGIELDYDSKEISFDECIETLEKGNLAALVYTSPSHEPDAPKWRILCPLSEPMSQTHRDHFVGRVAGLFYARFGKDVFDPASWVASQSYYYGFVEGKQAAHRVELVDGEAIDTLEDLDAVWRPKPLRSAKFADGHGSAHFNRYGGEETYLDLEAVYDAIASGADFHHALFSLAASLFGKGFDREDVHTEILAAMDRVPAEKRDKRWRLRRSPRHLESILNYLSAKENRKLFRRVREKEARQEDARTEEPQPEPEEPVAEEATTESEPKKKPEKGESKTATNVMTLRRAWDRHLELSSLVGHDEFTTRDILLKPIPDPDHGTPNGFEPRAWEDADDIRLAIWFQSKGYLKASAQLANQVMVVQAQRNKFHPVRDYLDGLKWDQGPRLLYLMQRGFGAKVDGNAGYLASVGRAWLIAAVARIYSPGCKVDTMPILEGPQGGMKSSGVRALCPNRDWFSDTLPNDLGHKDAKSHLSGNWLIEMSEISQLRKSEVENLKSFLSTETDKFRPSYGRVEVSRPRQCVFVGTTNEDQYLSDVTGNRRFWPVAVGRVDVEWIKANRDQLWAEARVAYRSGETWWLDGADAEMAERMQESRTAGDEWDGKIANYVEYKTRVTVAEILRDVFDMHAADHDKQKQMRVAIALKRLRWSRARSMVAGEVVRYWEKTLTTS